MKKVIFFVAFLLLTILSFGQSWHAPSVTWARYSTDEVSYASVDVKDKEFHVNYKLNDDVHVVMSVTNDSLFVRVWQDRPAGEGYQMTMSDSSVATTVELPDEYIISATLNSGPVLMRIPKSQWEIAIPQLGVASHEAHSFYYARNGKNWIAGFFQGKPMTATWRNYELATDFSGDYYLDFNEFSDSSGFLKTRMELPYEALEKKDLCEFTSTTTGEVKIARIRK